MGCGRIMAVSLLLVAQVVAVPVGASSSVGAGSSSKGTSPIKASLFDTLLPQARPLMGPSLVGGARSLIDLGSLNQEGEPNRIAYHFPFDDVNRDGTDDVLEFDLDLHQAHPTYGFVGVLRVTTLNGRSGRPLGERYELEFDSGVPGAVPALVGPQAEPGVIIILYRFLSTPSNPTESMEAIGVTARGEEVWTRKWVSTSTSTQSRFIAATNLAFPTDLLEERGRRGTTDLLLGIYDFAGPVLSVTPSVVSGVDGSSVEHERVTVPWLESTPIPVAAPDLNGDRRDDVVVVDTSGLGQGLRANAATGEELWHNAEAPAGEGHMTADLGNVIGDRTRDFALGAPVRLVDGGTGEVAWEREGGGYVVSYGDVDGDGKRDVFAGKGFFAENRFGADFKLISSRGRALAKRRFVAPRSPPGWSFIIYEDAGDTNGDGLGDGALHLLHYGENREVERRFIIDSATLAPLHRGKNLFPLAGRLTGATSDLVRVARKGSAARISSLRGDSGRTIWTRRITEPARRELMFHPTAAGGRAGHRNVLASFRDSRSARAYLLDGRTGQTLWTRVLRPTRR